MEETKLTKKIPTPNLRDKIAISILPEIVREQGQLKYGYGGCDNVLYDNCKLAYKIADSMIMAREN